jgi:NAD(P)-dependent dehydrogenase (short-subunit alcohol dehydrogenase family)
VRLEGKVAIITGAGGGQGQATAELFAAEGATVYATDLVVGEYGPGTVRHREQDITREDQWASLLDEVIDGNGHVDILVNNAAITGEKVQLHETSLGDWHHVVDTDLTGAFLGMRAVIPHMQTRKTGSIVNISSIRAFHPTRGLAPYHASKGGVRSLSKQAALSYAADGIRVNSIYPGIIDTPMLRDNRDFTAGNIAVIPLGRVGLAHEVANASLFLASDEASYVTGAELVIDGGLSL